jgi:hypothetical protein
VVVVVVVVVVVNNSECTQHVRGTTLPLRPGLPVVVMVQVIMVMVIVLVMVIVMVMVVMVVVVVKSMACTTHGPGTTRPLRPGLPVVVMVVVQGGGSLASVGRFELPCGLEAHLV